MTSERMKYWKFENFLSPIQIVSWPIGLLFLWITWKYRKRCMKTQAKIEFTRTICWKRIDSPFKIWSSKAIYWKRIDPCYKIKEPNLSNLTPLLLTKRLHFQPRGLNLVKLLSHMHSKIWKNPWTINNLKQNQCN